MRGYYEKLYFFRRTPVISLNVILNGTKIKRRWKYAINGRKKGNEYAKIKRSLKVKGTWK